MAGQTLANHIRPLLDTSPSGLGDVVPTGKKESVCLLASLNSGAADAYVTVDVRDTGGVLIGTLLFQEPVRYRQPGGSPVLLLNFILDAGQKINVTASAANVITATLFNRWQFDA